MKELIDAYIEDHETAWSPTTLRSERARLRSAAPYLDRGPDALYRALYQAKKKPYTIKTTFVRVCALETWAKNGTQYRDFMKKHGNRFKHAYVKEEVKISYTEAAKRAESLSSPYKEMALAMLRTGLRLSEMYVAKDGMVKGKGGKSRKVYGTIKETAPKSTFARKLKAVGLKPHTLRKLCATRLAEKGASPADLCKVFGWSAIGTAYQYLMPREDDKLAALMETCQEGS